MAVAEQEVIRMTETQTNGKPKAKDQIVAIALGKLRKIEEEMNAMFVEREEPIRDLILALIGKFNILFLGPPGTAKSLMSRTFTEHIVKDTTGDKAKFFEYLMMKSTEPSEFMGPFDPKALADHGRLIRKTEGYLPESDIAFMDEALKCNSAALNSLLPAMNERHYFEEGKHIDMNLVMMILASNEGIDGADDGGSSLEAFYDRIHLRHMVNEVVEPSNQMKMEKLSVESRNPKYVKPKKTLITVEEIHALNEKIDEIEVPDGIYMTFSQLKNQFEDKRIYLSGRRKVQVYQLMQAHALYNGRDEVCLDDLICLTNMIWSEPSQIKTVRDIIAPFVNRFETEAKQLLAGVRQVEAEIKNLPEGMNLSEKAGRVVEAKVKLDASATKMTSLIKECAANKKDTSLLEGYLKEIKASNTRIVKLMGVNSKTNTAQGDPV